MRDIAKVEVQQAKINAIKAKGSSLIGLQHLQNDDCILDTTKASEELWSLFEATKDPDPEIECKQFPVPSGATWENFTFEWEEEQLLNEERTQKAHKREIITVTCGKEARRYEPADLHMLDKKRKEPNLQWVLLRDFLQRNGTIAWGDKPAKDNVKTQKKELIKKLKKAFYQTEDPIPYTKSEGYKCRFICRTSGTNVE